jgi:hypothetical protein
VSGNTSIRFRTSHRRRMRGRTCLRGRSRMISRSRYSGLRLLHGCSLWTACRRCRAVTRRVLGENSARQQTEPYQTKTNHRRSAGCAQPSRHNFPAMLWLQRKTLKSRQSDPPQK